jgi:GT2 family glycosyltransferase
MVSIIILNFNGKKFLEDCIKSVLAQSYPDFELILFDNNSIDGSVKFARENFSDNRIKIIESKENLGFAGGNNEALKHTTCDLTVLLNNDTVVDKDWLLHLVNAMKENNTVASSFVITKGIDEKYYRTNGSVSYMMYNVMNIFENIEDEFYPNGCSVIFRKSETGEPFDSDYFYYSEDLYLGLKARFMGMKIKFVKDSKVRHFGGGSSTASALKTFYQSRNQMLNLYTFFSVKFILKLLPIMVMVRSVRTLAAIFSESHSFWGMFKVPFWIIFNMGTLRKKIIKNRPYKKIPEEEVIKYMTSKLVNHTGALNKMINKLSYLYSRLVGIKPIEYYQKK